MQSNYVTPPLHRYIILYDLNTVTCDHNLYLVQIRRAFSNMYYFYWCLAFLLQFNLVFTSVCDQSTCHECITDPNDCAWCAMKEFNETMRCKPAKAIPDGWCPELFQYSNTSLNIPNSSNKKFSDSEGNVVQIKPQKYEIKLRVGDSVDFNFSYFGSKDYPVDLYFLMDASSSMDTIKENTTRQSENIYETLRTKTKDVYLGLGTFIDKNVLPFTDRINSTRTYSFHHQLNLTGNYPEFRQKLVDTPNGENRDAQEGGLDALAQVMACGKKIGWRKESRKIIVFLTDGPYHVAGDGKAGGIFKPYDGGCHLENGIYTKETEMDYPTLGMINKLTTEKNIIIIFLTHRDVEFIYTPVQRAIRGSKFETFDIDKETTESDGLVTIIKNIYESITSNIVFQVDQKPGQNFELKFSPDCLKNNINNIDCKTKPGQKQDFNGTIRLTKYSGEVNAKISIGIEGISEKLTLDINVIHKCDCDIDTVVHSVECHNDTLQCGQCICSENRYGNKCACQKNENNPLNDDSTCLAEGSDVPCSDHGKCNCGACTCNTGYTGTFCQCYDAKCAKCSDHGTCECGVCKCDKHYSGDICQCHTMKCIAEEDNDNVVCSNRGICSCDKCDCIEISHWDKRSQNELCKLTPLPEFHIMQCKALEACVICKFNNETSCPACEEAIQIEFVQSLSEKLNEYEKSVWNECEDLSVDIGCKSRFLYRYDDVSYGVRIKAQREKNCAQNYWLYGSVVGLMLILIGVATLIGWKVVTYKRDKLEFKKFINQNKADISELDASENPLYCAPNVLFKNPGFRKRSFR